MRLTISRSTARKLGLSGRRRGTKRIRLTGAGQRRLVIRLSRSTLRAMRRERIRTVTFRLTAVVTDAERQRETRSESVRIRRN
jgi:hypothetical protein